MPSIKGTASVSDDHAMAKQLKSTKFPASFGTKVNLSKINKPVLSQWIEQQISKILGFEDEIVSSTAINLFLDGTTVDPRRAQLDLAGFLGEDQAAGFAESLWDMLVDAQAGSTGIPTKLLEEKKQELAKQQQLLQQQQQMQRDRLARGPPPHGRHPPQQHHDIYNNMNSNKNHHDNYNRGGEPPRRHLPDVRPYDRRPPAPRYNDRPPPPPPPPPPRGYPPGRRDERERRDRIAVTISPPVEDRKPAARDEFGREMKEDGPTFRPPPLPAHTNRDDRSRDQRPKDKDRRRRREDSSSSSEESSEESDESRHVNRRRRTTRRSPDDSSDDDRHLRHRSDDRRRYRSRSRERRSTNHRREADRSRSSRSHRERSYSPSDDESDSDE